MAISINNDERQRIENPFPCHSLHFCNASFVTAFRTTASSLSEREVECNHDIPCIDKFNPNSITVLITLPANGTHK